HLKTELAGYRGRFVGRTIIDHNTLVFGKGGLPQRFQTRAKKRGRIVDRHDYGNSTGHMREMRPSGASRLRLCLVRWGAEHFPYQFQWIELGFDSTPVSLLHT